MTKKIFSTVIAFVMASSVFVNLTYADIQDSSNVSAGEVASALREVGGIINQSDSTKTSSDSDSALKVGAADSGTVIDIAKDPNEGVAFSGGNGAPIMDISLPNANESADSKKIATGVVAYASDNGSANAVQAVEDGSVRMLTIIDNSDAPTEYDYGVRLSNGGHIEITNKGAKVVDVDGQTIAVVDAPWAKDANGKSIETYFITDGLTLTQRVKHNVANIVYPVTADPKWSPRYIARVVGQIRSDGLTYKTYPTAFGRGASAFVPRTAFNEFLRHTLIVGWPDSLFNQFMCHTQIAWWKSTWNLEPWRPRVSYAQTIKDLCNPGGGIKD